MALRLLIELSSHGGKKQFSQQAYKSNIKLSVGKEHFGIFNFFQAKDPLRRIGKL
jgi:hypothetical protein